MFGVLPVGSACNDGNPCTENDRCVQEGPALRCEGADKDCDDDNSCTADYCSVTGACEHINLIGSCDDGNACTTGDSCQNGVCRGGAAVVCGDSNDCTLDTCDPNAAQGVDPCAHADRDEGTACYDGDPCTLDDRCVDVPAAGLVCEGTPNDCDDANECTEDACQENGDCLHTPLTGTSCDDIDSCTRDDTCQTGACVGLPIRGCGGK